jgi:hypothetical protein
MNLLKQLLFEITRKLPAAQKLTRQKYKNVVGA